VESTTPVVALIQSQETLDSISIKQNTLIAFRENVLSWRGGRDSNIIPSMGARDWNQKTRPLLSQERVLGGGEGGIRTRDWFYPALT
jgi:hypothetical protein